MNKFSIGEKVVVPGTDNIGVIEQIKETKYTYKDNRTHSDYEYLVQYGESHNKKWFIESRLSYYLNDEISVNKVLIDMNLLYNLPFAKQLHCENSQLEAAKIEKDKVTDN